MNRVLLGVALVLGVSLPVAAQSGPPDQETPGILTVRIWMMPDEDPPFVWASDEDFCSLLTANTDGVDDLCLRMVAGLASAQVVLLPRSWLAGMGMEATTVSPSLVQAETPSLEDLGYRLVPLAEKDKPAAKPTPKPTARPEPSARKPRAQRPAANSSTTRSCDPSYPTLCLRPGAADLDCGDISARLFPVRRPDPDGFDGDGDGIGCET